MASPHTYRLIFRHFSRYMVALGLVGACVLLCLGIPQVMAPRPYLAFWPMVVVAAEFGGIGPGLLATVASILCVHFILNPILGGPLNLFDWVGMTSAGIFFAGTAVVIIFIGRKWKLQSIQRLQVAAMESATNGIALTDVQGVLLWVNPAFCTMTGYTSTEIVGKNYRLLDSEKQNEAFYNNIWSTVLKREVWHGDLVVRRKNGTTYMEERSVAPVTNADGRLIHCVIIMQDITERKHAEIERGKLEAQLLQAQKMESIGRLAGGVAHDFNNMLTIIQGYTQMCLVDLGPSSPLKDKLQAILNAANRSADLTRQLLAFARKQTIIPKVLDLNDTTTSMLKMLQRLIGEDIHLKWHPATKLWQVNMDPSQIDQILANLCVNARDSIKGNGEITIETANSIFDRDYCEENPGFVPGEFVLLEVSDDGCGMDKETQAQIFEPFFTTKALGEGTGLGLATVYGIVKQNNGFIRVDSEPDQGTTFKIYLPRHVGDDGQVLKEASAPLLTNGQGTILLVEDEASILNMTKSLLETHGYTVLAASKPSEAIALAKEYAGEIRLLMTDVVMPEMNGRELSNTLIELRPGLKCLFMSGYTANVIAHHGVLDKGVNFIAKPFSAQGLATKVHEALGGPLEDRNH